jgi:hypothetical protein
MTASGTDGKDPGTDIDLEALMLALAQFQAGANKDGVDTDDIPTGYGPFGRCNTNPIPTRGIPGSREYLARLRTLDGRKVESTRTGSTRAEDVTSGIIDMYKLQVGTEDLGTVFLCPYHRKTSGKAPSGFRLE